VTNEAIGEKLVWVSLLRVPLIAKKVLCEEHYRLSVRPWLSVSDETVRWIFMIFRTDVFTNSFWPRKFFVKIGLFLPAIPHFFFQTLMQFGIRDTRCLYGLFSNCLFYNNQCIWNITDLLGPRKFDRIFDIFLPTRGKFGTGNENRTLFGYCGFRENRCSERRSLLGGVNEILSCFPHLLSHLYMIW